jgi:hypothetical protein
MKLPIQAAPVIRDTVFSTPRRIVGPEGSVRPSNGYPDCTGKVGCQCSGSGLTNCTWCCPLGWTCGAVKDSCNGPTHAYLI